MNQPDPASDLTVSESGESSGHCDCCGSVTRRVWGFVDTGEATVAAYWVGWTEDHIDTGASIELCIGAWGDETTARDRTFVYLLHRSQPDGGHSFMVVDAAELRPTQKALADCGLRRDEVIGTPLAAQVFAIVDAIFLQDRRLDPAGG